MKTFFILSYLLVLIQNSVANDTFYYKENQKIVLKPLNSLSRSTTAQVDYYQNEDGIRLGIDNKLIVKLKKSTDLQKILNEFNLTVEKTLSADLYLLKTKDKEMTIDIANKLTKERDIEYAHPDFIKKSIRR